MKYPENIFGKWNKFSKNEVKEFGFGKIFEEQNFAWYPTVYLTECSQNALANEETLPKMHFLLTLGQTIWRTKVSVISRNISNCKCSKKIQWICRTGCDFVHKCV